MSASVINRTRLVQRLHAPSGSVDQPLSPLTGFTAHAREILRQLFTCDYMGSSDFEWGAIPKALKNMVDHKHKLDTDQMEIEVTPDPWAKRNAEGELERAKRSAGDEMEETGKNSDYFRKGLTMAEAQLARIIDPKPHPIYIIAPRKLMNYAKTFIAVEAAGNHRLHEPTHLRESFVGSSYNAKNIGWFELDNGFMFFSDWTMFDRVTQAFGLKHKIPAPLVAEAVVVPVRSEPAISATAPARNPR